VPTSLKPVISASAFGKSEVSYLSAYLINNYLLGLFIFYRTFKTQDGKEYSRSEIVRKAAIIDIYMRIRTTKDENFIRQFALLDDQAKEEMKKEKRRIQEQLRRIKRNQEKDSTSQGGMGGDGEGSARQSSDRPRDRDGSSSRPSKNSSTRKKKIKLKPDLKMKCGACGSVGHMRTNKACPLYNTSAGAGGSPPPSRSGGGSSSHPPMNVAMTQDEEEEIEKTLGFEDDELVRVDGTKVQLSSKVMRHAEDIKRRSLLLKVPKDAMTPPNKRGKKRSHTGNAEHCDYLARKGKTTNRRRIDPTVVISGIFEGILNELRDMSDSSQFLHPVSTKVNGL
jgi:transcription initiation factor TFIID subunit 1